MGKPTYRPRNKRRIRTHGFRARMADRWGREVLSRRRKKGRKAMPSRIGLVVEAIEPRSMAGVVWPVRVRCTVSASRAIASVAVCT